MITEEQQNLTKRNRWDIKYQILHNEWTELDCSCEVTPEELQEHLMVAHQGFLNVFGGMIDSAYTNWRIPFWVFDIAKFHYTKLWTLLDCIQMEVGPGPRHSHSAMTVLDCMYLFGGLREQRDLWRGNSTCHSWSCLNAMSGPSKLVGHSAYSCPYHKSTATMGQSVYNIDISKPLTHMTPYTLSAI